MTSDVPAVRLERLFKIYGPHPKRGLALLAGEAEEQLKREGHIVALNDVSLSVARGKIHVIMGLSGSGKSTLLRCINRLVEPSAGRIFIEGEDITEAGPKALRRVRSAKLGMVFQHFALLPHMTIIDNVAFGLRVLGVSRRERRDRAAEAIRLVGLEGWGDRKPRSLSGGMRQRVGLARALVMNTPILLMDEPFSALDPLIRDEMQQELLRLQANLNKSIVFVTHDPNEAITLGDRIAIMYKGQVVQESDPLSILLSPANDYVKNFVRGVSVFKILRASRVIDESVPAVQLGQDNPTPDHRFASGVAVLDENRRPVGVLTSQSLSQLLAAGRLSAWRECLSRDFLPLMGGTLIAPFISDISMGRRTIFVVDDQGSYLGMVTNQSILRALSAISLQNPEADTKSAPKISTTFQDAALSRSIEQAKTT
jgi:glycine betaine/proline transport system ATP-binding protein